jgi:REP-associated tyrosine transposase
MPRRGPIDPQGVYHISTRGNFGEPLFRNADQYALYLKLYAASAQEFGWITLDWTLLWNHHHVLIRLTEGGLSEGMRKVNHSFSRRMNAMYGRTNEGHLVRHCFYAGEIENEEHLFAACRYIDLNPVHARQCTDPAGWRWGGYRALIARDYALPFHDVSQLLSMFGRTPAAARRAYRRHVLAGLDPTGPDPFPGNGYEARMVESAV